MAKNQGKGIIIIIINTKGNQMENTENRSIKNKNNKKGSRKRKKNKKKNWRCRELYAIKAGFIVRG